MDERLLLLATDGLEPSALLDDWSGPARFYDDGDGNPPVHVMVWDGMVYWLDGSRNPILETTIRHGGIYLDLSRSECRDRVLRCLPPEYDGVFHRDDALALAAVAREVLS